MNWYRSIFKVAYQVQTQHGPGELVQSPNDKNLVSYFDYQTNNSYTEFSIVPLSLFMGILYPSATYVAIQASKVSDEIDRQVISLLMDKLSGFEDVQWSMGQNPMVGMLNKATGKKYTDDPSEINMTEIEETEVLPLPQGVSVGYTSDTLKIIWTEPGSARFKINTILRILEEIIQPFIENNLIEFYSIKSAGYGDKTVQSERGKQMTEQQKNKEDIDIGYLKFVLNTVLSRYPTLLEKYSNYVNSLYPDVKSQNEQKINLQQSKMVSRVFGDSSLDSEIFKAIVSFDENRLAMLENTIKFSEEKNLQGYIDTIMFWIANDNNFKELIDDIKNGDWLHFDKVFLNKDVQEMMQNAGYGNRISKIETAVKDAIPRIAEQQNTYVLTRKVLPIYKDLDLDPEVVQFLESVEQRIALQREEQNKRNEERRKEEEKAIRKRSFEMTWDHAYVDLNNPGDKFHQISDKYVYYFGGKSGSDLNFGEMIIYGKDIGVPFDDDIELQGAYEKAYEELSQKALENMTERPSETYGEDKDDVFYDIEEEFEEFLQEEFAEDLEKFDDKHGNDLKRDKTLIDAIKKSHVDKFIDWKREKMYQEEEDSGEYELDYWIDDSELSSKIEEEKKESAEKSAYEYGIMTAQAKRPYDTWSAPSNKPDSVEFTVHSKFLPQATEVIKEFVRINTKASRQEEGDVIFSQNSGVSIYFYDTGESINKTAYDISYSDDITATRKNNWYKRSS